MIRKFGDESYSSGFSFHGPSEPDAIRDMVNEVIKSVGMSPIFEKTIYTWTEDGIGFIYIQPLYESCVVVDVWPCHNGGYLYVISCKSFNPDDVAKTLMKNGYSPVICQNSHLFL